MKKIPFYQN